MNDKTIDLKTRLEELKRWSGLTWKDLSAKVGFPSTQNFTDMRNGRYGITPRVAEKICAVFPEISAEWLLMGKGAMMASESSASHDIPFYAGFSECGRVNPGTVFGQVDAALKVQDSAMEEYPKGSMVFLRKLANEMTPIPGTVYAVRANGIFVIRVVRESGDMLTLFPSCLDTLPGGAGLIFAPITIKWQDAEVYEVAGCAATPDGMFNISY